MLRKSYNEVQVQLFKRETPYCYGLLEISRLFLNADQVNCGLK